MIKDDKKGKFSLHEEWVEVLALTFLLIGFFISAFSGSKVISYFIIIVCGAISGRIVFSRKKKTKYAYYAILAVFLFGYILGNFYGSKKTTIFLFIISTIISYYAHELRYLDD